MRNERDGERNAKVEKELRKVVMKPVGEV